MNKVCLTCGHNGDSNNPLGMQGSYIIPYCHNCLMLAEKAAGKAIQSSDWYIKFQSGHGE